MIGMIMRRYLKCQHSLIHSCVRIDVIMFEYNSPSPLLDGTFIIIVFDAQLPSNIVILKRYMIVSKTERLTGPSYNVRCRFVTFSGRHKLWYFQGGRCFEPCSGTVKNWHAEIDGDGDESDTETRVNSQTEEFGNERDWA